MLFKKKKNKKCQLCLENDLSDDPYKIIVFAYDCKFEMEICDSCKDIYQKINDFREKVDEKANENKLEEEPPEGESSSYNL